MAVGMFNSETLSGKEVKMAMDASKKEIVAVLEKAISIVNKMGVTIEEFRPGNVRVRLPKEPNVNHVGMLYAGSLFSLGDYTGGVLFISCFDLKQYYPILKEASITYKRPATTDVTIEASLTPAEIEDLKKKADNAGKADLIKEFELRGADGSVCCVFQGNFQLRKV
jgi:thioesterase domain-containing protein